MLCQFVYIRRIKVTGANILYHIAPELEKIDFKRNTVSQLSVPATPPWLLRRPVIDPTLHSSDKSATPPEVLIARFYELCDRFKNFFIISTPMILKSAA